MKTNEMIAEELGMTVEELEEMIEEEAEKYEVLRAAEHGIALWWERFFYLKNFKKGIDILTVVVYNKDGGKGASLYIHTLLL